MAFEDAKRAAGNPRQAVEFVRERAKASNRLFAESLPMIASENVLSPRALEMLTTDFHGRYAEGLPGKRYYQGTGPFDDVEVAAIELGRRLFGARWVNVQSTSGTVSNMAVLKALAKPGDPVTAVGTADGGHISHAKMGSVGLRGLEVHEYPWDEEGMHVDPDGAAKLIRRVKPPLAIVGQSVFLFPTALTELRAACDEVGAHLLYDGAHVLGLISGGRFQDPLREGADVMTGSTHKTLPGPQGGVVLSDHDEATEEGQKFLRKLDLGVFPGVTSSYHLHHVAAKAVCFAEHLEFGRQYATDIVANAKALAHGLAAEGFKVFGEARDYTESHQCLVQVGGLGEGKGKWAAERLENAGIITNMNMVPGDTSAMKPSGLRLGVQELTRIGFGRSDMAHIASLFARVVLKEEGPAKVRAEVREIRKDHQVVRYCFNEKELGGYDYHALF